MNRNTIISLSMLYALWQTERKDLLDLIRPFVMYAVGSVTAVGSQVNETEVCKAMEREFGYKTFQPAVIHRILSREAATTIEKDRRKIVKRSGHFFLVASLSALNEDFINKRTQCKAHTDAVTKALSEYLNKNNVYGRSDFSQEESERMLERSRYTTQSINNSLYSLVSSNARYLSFRSSISANFFVFK